MPKIVDHHKLREDILDRCFKIFSKKGYSGVSMREIAAEAGLSTGSIYHYFKNKEDILEQMFTHIRSRNFGNYQEMVKDVENIEERINKITEFWKDHITDYQDLFLLSIDYFRNKITRKRNKMFHDFAEFYISALSDTLDLSPLETEILFTYLMGLVVNSLLVPSLVDKDTHILMLDEVLKNNASGIMQNKKGHTERTSNGILRDLGIKSF